MNSVRAGSAYFGGMFLLGFALGTIRVLLLEPRLGASAATLMELPIMLGVSWFYCGWLLQRFRVAVALAARVSMGAVALALLLVAEGALGAVLFARSAAEQVGAMTDGPGLVGLIGQFVFAFFPVMRLYTK